MDENKDGCEEVIEGSRSPTGNVIQVLREYNRVSYLMRKDLYSLATAVDWLEPECALFEDIEKNHFMIQRFLVEKAYGQIASYYDPVIPTLEVHDFCGAQFLRQEDDALVFEFPAWAARDKPPRKGIPPIYHHRKSKYVLEQHFWFGIVGELLKRDGPGILWNQKSLTTCWVDVEFRTTLQNARDLDHYHLSPLVNALKGHRIIASDHPSVLQQESRYWQEVECEDDEKMIATIQGT